MDLYLIRHGETVDNVAGLYAGVRDSALTNHGVDQARRLGRYFAKEHVAFTHIFSSPLSRALKTADALRSNQSGSPSLDPCQQHAEEQRLAIVQVADLIEQDFGFYEGKSFFTRKAFKKSGEDSHYEAHKNDRGFVDMESKEAMAKRADAFLDQHLMPLFETCDHAGRITVAVVSHGMLLSSLWKRLLLRLPRKSVSIAPEITAARGAIVLEHPGGWSNTGYIHLSMERSAENPKLLSSPSQVAAVSEIPVATAVESQELTASGSKLLHGWSTVIVGINKKDHLIGLKRQLGGIGRSAYDEGQKKLTGFFKKQRTS